MTQKRSKSALFTVTILFTLAVGSHLVAQDAEDTADHTLVSRYVGSVIDGYEVRDFDDFDLPIGPVVKDADGQRVPSKKKTLEGKITRILYRGPEGRSTLEIMHNYKAAFERDGFEILYACSGEECGRLFHWALYHDDTSIKTSKTSGGAFDSPKDLRYLAATKSTSKGLVHVSLLVAIDSIWTKKSVTLLEVIESEAMDTGMVTVDTMAKGIDSAGHVAIYGIYFDTNSANLKPESHATLEEISRLLTERPSLNLLVVGHTDNQGGYDHNMDLSRRRAEAVVKTLTNRFAIDSKRLRPAGVGFLSPVAANDTPGGRGKNRRVELVKR